MERGKYIAIRLGWLLGINAVAATGRAENEFVAHSAETYGSSGMCAGDALTNANEDALYLDNGLSGYDQLEYWTNAFYDARDFIDKSFTGGDDDIDPSGTDFADVIFVSGHGGATCTGDERAWLTPGDNVDGCTFYLAHASSSSRHVRLGGTVAGSEADVLVTYACNTTHYCVYTAGAYGSLSASDGQFNVLNGFHGDVAEVAGYQSDLGSYSNDVLYNYIGDAWLDWMYANLGGGEENCPSTITWGANTQEVDDAYEFHGWFDLQNTGARTVSKFFKFCGCDPRDGAALPAC